MVNVLDNAAKYAPRGSEITVSAGVDDGRLLLSVSDLGPGIPAVDRERVFDMFYRVDSGDRHSTGTGLGLAIARGIVQAHGGIIRAVPAAPGLGTTIAMEFPLGEGEPSAPTSAGPLADVR